MLIALCALAAVNANADAQEAWQSGRAFQLAQRVPFRSGARPRVAQQASGTVRGVVFDSLAMTPAAGALVWIPGTSYSTTTDANGRYSLSNVPEGAHFIAFSSPVLDSLGLSALGVNATVRPNEAIELRLTTPSFPVVARALCGERTAVGQNAGIVWGAVRDAATGIRQSGARANFSWRDVSVDADKQVHSTDAARSALTDSAATYYACGLPTDVTLLAHADGARAASGELEFTIGARRLRRVDWLVSTDMVFADTVSQFSDTSSSRTWKPRGDATLRGVVLNENAVPVVNTDVALASVDTSVRTNAAGEFTLGGMPAGTHELVVRRVGVAPVRMPIDLIGGAVQSVTVTLPTTQLLEKIDVRADKRAIADRLDYESRRKEGFGYAFDEKAFKGHESLATVLQGAVPSTEITRKPGGYLGIKMRRISLRGGPIDCDPIIWEDGRKAGLEALEYPVEHYRAIEIYNRATDAPSTYVGVNQSCGVVLVWTKFARW